LKQWPAALAFVVVKESAFPNAEVIGPKKTQQQHPQHERKILFFLSLNPSRPSLMELVVLVVASPVVEKNIFEYSWNIA
jgi:hypothetical protein